jgi:hypothetical protein
MCNSRSLQRERQSHQAPSSTYLGGGINSFSVTEVPTMFKGVLVVRLLADRSEVGSSHAVDIDVKDSADVSALSTPIHFDVRPRMPTGLPRGWPVAMNLNIDLTGLQLPRLGQSRLR